MFLFLNDRRKYESIIQILVNLLNLFKKEALKINIYIEIERRKRIVWKTNENTQNGPETGQDKIIKY
jgi:hypothetical protein